MVTGILRMHTMHIGTFTAAWHVDSMHKDIVSCHALCSQGHSSQGHSAWQLQMNGPVFVTIQDTWQGQRTTKLPDEPLKKPPASPTA